MNQNIATPGTLDSLSGFLKYGPTGLAGLLLTLVVVVLCIREMTIGRERLLRQFMYVGAGCFALALAANFFAVSGSYKLFFEVQPLDLKSNRTLPPPEIKVNGTPVDDKRTYLVKSEVIASIDVSEAFDLVRQIRSQNQRFQSQNENQRKILTSVTSISDAIATKLSKIPSIIDKNCPGGSNGVSATSNSAVLTVVSESLSTLSGMKASVSSAAIGPPAETR